jgi:hypothetical protein
MEFVVCSIACLTEVMYVIVAMHAISGSRTRFAEDIITIILGTYRNTLSLIELRILRVRGYNLRPPSVGCDDWPALSIGAPMCRASRKMLTNLVAQQSY